MMTAGHQPVMVDEVVACFAALPLGDFCDATVGAAGHAQALLQAHPKIGRYFACDCDPAALRCAQQALRGWGPRVQWLAGNFGQLRALLAAGGVGAVDGFLFDLGISSLQLADAQRGFSFQRCGPLDMRIDPQRPLTAEDLVNSLSERQLAALLRQYGEPRGAIAARAIIRQRAQQPLQTTQQLEAVLFSALRGRRRAIHPATRAFQALRIAVNCELEMLQQGLQQALQLLRPGGRIAVLSFHSLEDGIVKRALQAPLARPLSKKPLLPTAAEVRRNRRARSAKLRLAEKL